MKTLALIPARGGSKGIPKKNVMALCGRPLIAHTIEAARASQGIDRVIVSTDDEEIAEIAKIWGAEVPFLRPPELANDEAPMLGVVAHALQWYEQTEGALDAIVLLQPTSPLRTAQHVDAALSIYQQHRPSSVVSVVEVPHQFNPLSVMAIADGRLYPCSSGAVLPTRRQDKPRVYARNGPAVLVSSVATIKSGQLYGDVCMPYLMSSAASLDIDTMDEFAQVEWLLSRNI